MRQQKTSVGVLGCTGLVGQHFVRLLDGHPWFRISLLAASPKSAGKSYQEACRWIAGGEMPPAVRDMTVVETSPDLVTESGCRVFFSALPAGIAGPLEAALRAAGYFIFTNASARRMDADVPILIPEINPDHASLLRDQIERHGGFIAAGSNCTTAGLVLGLKPLDPLDPVFCTVTTFQSLSGAGRTGLAALDISGNVLPFIGGEEDKMRRETRKILGRVHSGRIVDREISIRPTCCRVPVQVGHLLSIEVETARRADVDEVRELFKGFHSPPQVTGLPTAPETPIIVRVEEDRPQPLLDAGAGRPERARGMAATVGRIQADGRRISFLLLVNNLVRGAAGNVLLAAEFTRKGGLLP
ncbi:MAG: aspartate-semialdehyde dehydrogenase [Acidobacteriota bacterium]|nr:aspartate-semialdehyde dehydrogenase [Acidobacteriota bacterium]